MASCRTCGADWSKGAFTTDCGECGGGAMDHPCLVCGGRCSAKWERAVSDSNDSHLGHWAGICLLPEAERRAALKSRGAP